MGEGERQFDDFDAFADDYRAMHTRALQGTGADSDYYSRFKVEDLARHEDTQTALHILDFGCGDGNSVVHMRQCFPHAAISGVDVSSRSIEQASKRGIAGASFDVFDGAHLPHADATFDVVFASMVFHHIQFQLHASVLQEIRRVLKPGGRFHNYEHNPYNPLTRKVVRDCEFDTDAVLLKPSYTRRVTEDAGMQVEADRGAGGILPGPLERPAGGSLLL